MDEQSLLELVAKFLKSKGLDRAANALGDELGRSNSPSKVFNEGIINKEELSQLYNGLKIDEENASPGLPSPSFSTSKDISFPVSINSGNFQFFLNQIEGSTKNTVVDEISSSPEVSGDITSVTLQSRPEPDIIVEDEYENEENEGNNNENGNAVDVRKNYKTTITFNEETIRDMELLRNSQDGTENANENNEVKEIGSRNSSNLRSRTGSTSSARSSKSVSFATSSDEEDAGEISDEWSDDDDPGYMKIPSETLEYFQYSDDEEPENEGGIDMQIARISNTLNLNINTNPNALENENYDWEPATQEDTLHTPTGNQEISVGIENTNESFGNEFEVEKLNQILSDHIQLQRDEYYQESFGDLGQPPKQWNDKQETPNNPVNDSKMEEDSKPSTPSQLQSKNQIKSNMEENSKETYPNTTLEFKNFPDEVLYESFNLPIICERGRTGLQESKDFPIEVNSVIAGRYQIIEYLGSAAFSKAIRCLDMVTSNQVCIKIIKNNKEYLDQSLDEIRLLQYINANGDPDEKNVLQLYDYFYHKEHLFIVCELLRDNLYEFYKYNRESSDEFYFNIDRLKKITKQCLVALDFIHGLKLIHCDLKPENILIKSYSRCEVKIIDFGSSCFTRDHLSSYVQSRSYRAPEVILGMSYDSKIDIWSLGCILAELWTGKVLFNNESIPTLLARVAAILGPFDKEMLKNARYAHKYFTKNCALYEKKEGEPGYTYLKSKRTTLKNRLKCDDSNFVDFISKLLTVNPTKRPNASEALKHPFVKDL